MTATAKRVDTSEIEDKAVRTATMAALRMGAVAAYNKLSYTVEEACEATGVGKTTLYEEAADGHLAMGKIRGRTVIEADELRRWFKARFELIRKPGSAGRP